MNEVTVLIEAIQAGDPHAAEQLLPLIYEDLRRLAGRRLTEEGPGQTLQPTALVHEAYLRLVGDGRFLLPRLGRTSWMSEGPDGKLLAVPLDEDVVLFEPASGNYLRELKGPGGRVIWVVFSPDSRLLAATTWYEGNGGFVRVWDLVGQQQLFTKPVPGAKVSGAAVFSGDGKRLYAEGQERIHVWDIQSGQELQSRQIHPPPGVLPVHSPPGHLREDGTVRLWDITRPGESLVRTIGPGPFGGPVRSLAFTPDGRYLATANANGTVYVLRMEDVR